MASTDIAETDEITDESYEEDISNEDSYEEEEDDISDASYEEDDDIAEATQHPLLLWIKRNTLSLAVSAAAHLVLLLIISLLPGQRIEKEEDVVIITEYAEEEVVEEVEEIEKIEIELTEVEIDHDPTEQKEVEQEVEVEVEAEITEEVEELDSPVMPEESMDIVEAMPSMLGVLSNSAASKAPSGGFLGNRGSSKSRIKKGGASNEKVVNLGLAWLAAQQRDNGSWPNKAHINAVTSAAALAFLGHGNSTSMGPYKEVLQKFVNYYLAKQKGDGGIGNHGHATPFVLMAMFDAYAMDSSYPGLKNYCEGALKYILDKQTIEGGWSGGKGSVKKNSNEVDIAQTAWYIMALVSAKLAGLEVPNTALKKARDVLIKIESGKFKGKVLCTSHGGQKSDFNRKYAIQSYLVTVLQFLGVPKTHPSVSRPSKYIIKNMPDMDKSNLWLCYNQGMGMFQLGSRNSEWKKFNHTALNGIRRSHVKDHNDMTYWNKSQLYKGGKSNSDTGAKTAYWGDCGATAMAILNLQVYYRYDLIENMKTKLVN